MSPSPILRNLTNPAHGDFVIVDFSFADVEYEIGVSRSLLAQLGITKSASDREVVEANWPQLGYRALEKLKDDPSDGLSMITTADW